MDAKHQPEIREDDILDLIERADAHELGRDYLLHGALGAVAATFGVSAWLVDAARDHVASTPPPT